MFWKLVKYELQSVRKWYLGIYGIAILLSIPLGLMLRKSIMASTKCKCVLASHNRTDNRTDTFCPWRHFD